MRSDERGRRRGRRGGDPQAKYQRAVALYHSGDYRRAGKVADAMAKRLPDDPAVRQLQGAISLAAGKPATALKAIKRGLAVDPMSAELNDLLGVALVRVERPEDAVEAHRKALSVAPDDPAILNNLGNALRAAGRPAEARDAYRESLARRPDNPDTLSNLGLALIDLEDFENAEAALRSAAKRAPNMTDVHANLAFILMKRHSIPEAIEACRQALNLDPGNVGALNNLSRAFMGVGRHDEAEAAARRALAVDPRHTGALMAMAIQHFLRGRWSEAWTSYELRWRIEATRRRQFPQPLWAGEPIKGKSILVWGEQGVGDEIMFTGMVPDLVERGARVILELDARLVALYRRSFPSVTCVPRRTPAATKTGDSGIDFQTPCGSLGRWLRPDEASFPKRRSFLAADPARLQALRRGYSREGRRLLVGISWRSVNADIGSEKTIDLMRLASFARVPGIQLVDLQYGNTDEELATFARETGASVLRDPEIDPLEDLDAFAAQVAAMDLVVSVSNTTVHVAGALGIPTWVMLPTTPLWRWMMERTDSPWYSSVRLFRQTQPGNWTEVIDGVARKLADVAGGANGLPGARQGC